MQAFSSGNEGFSHQSKSEGFDNLTTAKSESKKNQLTQRNQRERERERERFTGLIEWCVCVRERE